MKTPLVPVALLYAAGVLVGLHLEAPIGALLVCGAIAVAALMWNRARAWLLGFAIFLFGWLNVTIHSAIVSPIDLRTLLQQREVLATVRGTVVEAPVHRVYLRDDRESWRTIAEVRVEAIQVGDHSWESAHGSVLTLTSGLLDDGFVDGQHVEATGVLMQPPLPIAPGLFDYRRHLARRGIHYQLKLESPRDWKTLGTARQAGLAIRFRSWAQQILARGLPGPDEALRLQYAMLLGWQTALTSEVSEPFMRSGTMHIFAISGLHIALIAGILIVVLRALLIPRFACGLIILPLIWFYTAATGWQPSAVRSTIMMSVIIAGWMLHRPLNLLNSLAAAALVILVYDPQQLFQASFQLSFFVVLSIALLVPKLDALKARWIKPDPMLPMELRPAWNRFAWRCGDVVWKCFATSVAAFLGSIPLIAYYFHLFTPGSLLANLVVVPTSALALMSGLGALATGAWLPPLAECFNHSGWFFMRAMMWLSEGATHLPLSWFHVRAPGLLEFAIYYGVLLSWLAGGFAKPACRWVLAAGFGILTALSTTAWFTERGAAALTILPLNGTHALATRAAHSGDWMLINCGDAGSFPFVIKPFLQSFGINRLPHLILAQNDMPHAGAMLAVHELFPVSHVHASPHVSRSTRFRELLSDLELRATVHANATAGTTWGQWRVLHPGPHDKSSRAQDTALVLGAEVENVRVLAVGDLGLRGQSELLSKADDVRADILISGIPDRAEALPAELIERVRPRLIVVADADYPAAKRASPALQARLRRSGVPVVYTRDAGAVTIRLRSGAWKVTSAR